MLVKLPALFLIPPPVNVGGCLNHEDFLHLPSCSSECPAAAGRAREVEQSSQQREGWTRQRGKWTERGGSLTNKTFPASHRIPATEFLHEPLSPADTRHQSQAAANVTLLVDKTVFIKIDDAANFPATIICLTSVCRVSQLRPSACQHGPRLHLLNCWQPHAGETLE